MQPRATEERVTCAIEGRVAHVRLNRPDKLNALTLGMLDELAATAHSLRRRTDVRAVVIAGEGEAFCAGLDLRAATADPRGIARRFLPGLRGTNTFQEACWAWRRLSVPVVAVVHGHCLGAGVQLALGADLRVSTPDAQWSVRETRWGLVPDMSGTRTLVEVVGLDVAKDLTLTARAVSGTEAHRLGLVTRVAEDAHAEAAELVSDIIEHDREAVARGKRLLNRAVASSARAAFARERRAQLRLLARMDRSGLPGRSSSADARP